MAITCKSKTPSIIFPRVLLLVYLVTSGAVFSQDAMAPIPVGGSQTFGSLPLTKQLHNEVLGPVGPQHPGLNHEWWFTESNPDSLTSVRDVFRTTPRARIPFSPEHESSWWTGSQDVLPGTMNYPDEIRPLLADAADAGNYTARLTGEIFIPETGTYRFADGIDDFTYLAVDLDGSGAAGDEPAEVLINDNDWTSIGRDANNGGGPIGSGEFVVSPGGDWRLFELAMAEGGGMDAGIIYWDYDVEDADGDGTRVGDALGFPQRDADPIDLLNDAANLYIPNSHLRAAGLPSLLSADLVAKLEEGRTYELELDGDSGASDLLKVDNPNPDVYTGVLDLNGSIIKLMGDRDSVSVGDTFHLIDADLIVGQSSFITSDPAVIFDTSRFSDLGDVMVIGVPEPPSLLLLLWAIPVFSRRRA